RDQQVRGHVLALLRAAAGALDAARCIGAGQRQAQPRAHVVGRARHAADGDAGVLLFEGAVELLELGGLPATDPLGPDGPGDLAHLGRVGLHGAGLLLALAAVVIVGATAWRAGGQEQDGGSRSRAPPTTTREIVLHDSAFRICLAECSEHTLRYRHSYRPARKPSVAMARDTSGTASSGRTASRNS